MNNNIKELVIEATADAQSVYGWSNEYFEKFAKLIVKECARIADAERDYSVGCGYVTKTSGTLIKEHFGVKE